VVSRNRCLDGSDAETFDHFNTVRLRSQPLRVKDDAPAADS